MLSQRAKKERGRQRFHPSPRLAPLPSTLDADSTNTTKRLKLRPNVGERVKLVGTQVSLAVSWFLRWFCCTQDKTVWPPLSHSLPGGAGTNRQCFESPVSLVRSSVISLFSLTRFGIFVNIDSVHINECWNVTFLG